MLIPLITAYGVGAVVFFFSWLSFCIEEKNPKRNLYKVAQSFLFGAAWLPLLAILPISLGIEWLMKSD